MRSPRAARAGERAGRPAGEVAPRAASGRAPSPAPHPAAASQVPQVRRSLSTQLSSVEPGPAARPDNRWAAAPQARPGQARASRPQPSTEAPPGRGARSYLRHVGRATGSHRRGGSRPEPGCAPGPRGSRRRLRRRLGGNAQEPPARARHHTPLRPLAAPGSAGREGRGPRARAEQGARGPVAAVPGERARGGPEGRHSAPGRPPRGTHAASGKIPPILHVGHFWSASYKTDVARTQQQHEARPDKYFPW